MLQLAYHSETRTHSSCLRWVKVSGWHPPFPSLAPEPSFSPKGAIGSSWIDQVLLKGSAPICTHTSHLNIDHRPITAAFFSPLFAHLTAPSFPKGLLRFPAASPGKREEKKVERFVQNGTDSPSLIFICHPLLRNANTGLSFYHLPCRPPSTCPPLPYGPLQLLQGWMEPSRSGRQT